MKLTERKKRVILEGTCAPFVIMFMIMVVAVGIPTSLLLLLLLKIPAIHRWFEQAREELDGLAPEIEKGIQKKEKG